VDGLLVSPGYAYKEIDGDLCMTREETQARFKRLMRRLGRHRIWNSRLYLDFLTGDRDLDCAPWGNPTFNPQGWRGPCYILGDGHFETFEEMMEAFDWPRFEKREDPRCEHCLMHCGHEPSAAISSTTNLRDGLRMLRWSLVGS
jgi:hypothetical protein